MKLGEKVTCPDFAGLSFCGRVPVQSVCPEALRAELKLRWAGWPFPRACWQLSPRWEGEGKTRARAQCEQRLLLCSVAVPTQLGQVGPKMLEQNSEGWVQTGSTPCKCAPTSSTLAPLPQRVAELEGGMLEQPLVRVAVPVVQPWHTIRAPDPAPLARLASLPRPDVCVPVCSLLATWNSRQILTLDRSCSLSCWLSLVCLAFSLSLFHPNRKAKGDSVHFWVSILPGPWVAFWVQWIYDCFWMPYGFQIHTPVLLRVLSIHGPVYGFTLIPLSLVLCVYI